MHTTSSGPEPAVTCKMAWLVAHETPLRLLVGGLAYRRHLCLADQRHR